MIDADPSRLAQPLRLSPPAAALAFTAILAAAGAAEIGAAPAGGYSVHEWGTFTTLVSSDGTPLSGLYVDATRLPGSVYGLPSFNYDTAAGAWPSPDKLRNVTVKMETPVLYFHAHSPLEVEVDVRFRGGAITQWYPERQGGEADPGPGIVDMAAPREGRITWRAHVLGPDESPAYTIPDASTEPGMSEWRAPRYAVANRVQGAGGEVEKFLFYRGLGNFESPLAARFETGDTLRIENRSGDVIPYAMAFELPRRSRMGTDFPRILWEGTLPAGAKALVRRGIDSGSVPVPPGQPPFAPDRLREALVTAGLNADEAAAMLQTWEYSYFSNETGLKVFYIVPRRFVDSLLPLTINPAPQMIARVLVGRYDILVPELESELIAAEEADTLDAFGKEKYYLAYRDFLARRKLPLAIARRPDARKSAAHAVVRNGSRWGWYLPPGSAAGAAGARNLLGRNVAAPSQPPSGARAPEAMMR